MIFVISGPSGCGKSTLVRRLLDEVDDIEFSVSHTTRPQRPGEEEGRDYFFVGTDEFKQMVDSDRLVEWAKVHGYLYGTSRREIEKKSARKSLMLDIDIQGARQVRDKFKKATSVFVLPPVFHELRKRLEQRGQDRPEAIRRRLKEAKKEIRAYPEFDYVIVNDLLEQAVLELKSIVICHGCRLEVRQKEIVPILRSFVDKS